MIHLLKYNIIVIVIASLFKVATVESGRGLM